MGDYRFFLVPKGLIKKEELPKGWGLLEWNGKKVRKVVGPKGNIWSTQTEFRHEKDSKAEYKLFYSVLRRVQLNGDLDKIYKIEWNTKNQ